MIIKEWEHAGMQCALRHGVYGAPCGYVAIGRDHPLRNAKSPAVWDRLAVHGGVTFTGRLKSDKKKRWWVGFDMAHYGDFDPYDYERCIRTDDECVAETNRLAEQLAKMEVGR